MKTRTCGPIHSTEYGKQLDLKLTRECSFFFFYVMFDFDYKSIQQCGFLLFVFFSVHICIYEYLIISASQSYFLSCVSFFSPPSFYLHQLPAQMGSLLGSSLPLQYLDFVQDESALLRLNFWLGYALHEGKGGGGEKQLSNCCNIFCQEDSSKAKNLG